MVDKGSGQTEDKGAVCKVGRVRAPARARGRLSRPPVGVHMNVPTLVRMKRDSC